MQAHASRAIVLGGTRNIFWVWMNPMGNAENFRFSFLCQGSLGVPFQSLITEGKPHPPGYQAQAVHETFFASAA